MASLRAMVSHISELLKGTPASKVAGHGASFVVLADRLVKDDGRIALVLPATALFGSSWSGIRCLLSTRYEIEFVVSSHDPQLTSMSFDTGIAEVLIVARRLSDEETPSKRGKFVNLLRTPKRETDALALLGATKSVSSMPGLVSDGPPVGGVPLMVGGERWGEVVEGPLGSSPWKAARWSNALLSQFARGIEGGVLWSAERSALVGQLPIERMSDVCSVGPEHKRIKGSTGAFDAYHGQNDDTQYQALWRHSSTIHKGVSVEPNAWLAPNPGRAYDLIWSNTGTLHFTADVRYNSQRVMATRTPTPTLGVRAWFTLTGFGSDHSIAFAQEAALVLWFNSTFGLLLHANCSNRAQQGRGTGSKEMLLNLPILDVRALQPWQLDQAKSIWRDFVVREFRPFHECAVDAVRIELDERIIKDLFGFGDEATETVARIRELLANEPSIYGSKRPVLPA